VSASGWIADARRTPLGEVLTALGLRTEHADRRARPHACPACNAPGVAELGDRGDGARWHCHRCGESGDTVAAVALRVASSRKPTGAEWAPVRDWFAARGWCEADTRRAAPAPAPVRPLAPRVEKPQRKLAVATVAAGLREAGADCDAPRLVGWWIARGFPDADAERLAGVGDVHALRDDPGVAVRALLTATERRADPNGRRTIWFTRRDPAGAPCSVERRWAPGATPKPGDNDKAKGLGGAPAGVFGCEVRAAQALAAGGVVVVVEGAPDWACAVAAAPAGAAVVGAPGKDAIPGLVGRILDRARRTDGARMGRLVVVPHTDDGWKRDATPNPSPCAERCAQAIAEALDAGVSCAWVRLPFGPAPLEGRAGVGDLAELRSLDAIAEALDNPEPIEPEPIAEPVESMTLDDPDALREWTRRMVAAAGPDKVVVGAAAPGMGKSYAAAHVCVEAVAEGRWVLNVAPSHDLATGVGSDPERVADAAAERIRRAATAAGLTVLVHTPAGLTRLGADKRPLCKALDDTEGTTDHHHLAVALAAVGRKVCGVPNAPGACPHAAACPVRPLLPDDTTRPAVVACVAAQAEAIWGALPAAARRNALVVLDDVPAVPGVAEVTQRELEGAGKALNDGARLKALCDALDALASRQPMPDDAHHDVRVLGPELAAALAPVPGLAELRTEWPRGSTVQVEPSKAEAGRLGVRYMLGELVTPDTRAAVEACVAVASGEPAGEPLALALKVKRDSRRRLVWTLELRRAPWMPAGAAVVALDGTAHVTPLDWAHAAQGRTLDVHRLTVRRPPQPAARWIRLGSLDAGAMFETLTDGRIGISKTGAAAFAARTVDLAGRCQIEGARKVGIITLKAVADAARLGLGLDVRNLRIDPQHPGVVAVGETARTLRDLGFDLTIGHFGADGVGSNRFKDCDALAVLGTPRPPESAMRADCDAMGLDPESHWRELRAQRVERDLRQAIARARHVRNPGRLLYVVASTAPVEGHDLPGVAWAVESPNAGAAAGDWRRVVRLAVLVQLATERGALVVSGVAELGDARTWAADAQTIAEHRGWVETTARAPGRGRPSTAWAPAGVVVDANAERAALAAAVESNPVANHALGINARFADLTTTPGVRVPTVPIRKACEKYPGLDLAPVEPLANTPPTHPADPAPVEAAEALAFASPDSQAAPLAMAAHRAPRPPAWAARHAALYAALAPPAAVAAEPATSPPVAASWAGLPCPPAPPPMPALMVEWAAEELALAGVPDADLAAEVAFQTGCGSAAAADAARLVAAFYATAWPPPPPPSPWPSPWPDPSPWPWPTGIQDQTAEICA
jgi:hypothetical protein